MAEVTMHAEKVKTVMVDPFLDHPHKDGGGGPFVVVKLIEENARIFVGDDVDSIRRARAIAAALNTACDVLRGRAVVPIASLAPDLPPAA